jgi:hypothetical protein
MLQRNAGKRFREFHPTCNNTAAAGFVHSEGLNMKTKIILLTALISVGLLTGASAFARGGGGGGGGNGGARGGGTPVRDGSGQTVNRGNPKSQGTPLKDGSGKATAPGKGAKDGTGPNAANCPNK